MMRIREEIEKLRKTSGTPQIPGILPDYQRAFNERYNDAILDALSILDKWELLGEGTAEQFAPDFPWAFIGRKWEGPLSHFLDESLRPGDHIIIWRRKDE